jgi:6-phosphogluconolactonase
MEGETANREEAARRYEATLRKQFGVSPPAWPRFDVVLLGLGEDGHTASLFPGTPVLNEQTRLVVTNEAPEGVPHRLTLTAAAINRAWAVMFLVVGSAKAEAVRAVLESLPAPGQKPEQTDLKFPARLIQPMDGRLIWFLDRGAALRLAISRQGIVSHEE